MYVHVKGHKPEWGAVYVPAVPLRVNMKDDALMQFEKNRMRRCMWPYQKICDIGTEKLAMTTGRQPGSVDCPAVFGQNYSPLVIDMSGYGIRLTAPDRGVKFDILGTGEKLAISWMQYPDQTPFVVLDRNKNGRIDSVHEMFGNHTVGPDGKKSRNGFEALRKYDENNDGVINPKDSIWPSLRLWFDLNSNGITDPNELVSLAARDLASIDLFYVNAIENADFYGNRTQQRSVVDLRDGRMRSIFDLWFVPGIQ
jgi:hypothetical protein